MPSHPHSPFSASRTTSPLCNADSSTMQTSTSGEGPRTHGPHSPTLVPNDALIEVSYDGPLGNATPYAMSPAPQTEVADSRDGKELQMSDAASPLSSSTKAENAATASQSAVAPRGPLSPPTEESTPSSTFRPVQRKVFAPQTMAGKVTAQDSSVLRLNESCTTQPPTTMNSASRHVHGPRFAREDVLADEERPPHSPDTEAAAASLSNSISPTQRRGRGKYGDLSIKKPTLSEPAEAFVKTPTETSAEAQIRAAGTDGALLPMFDRAKQVLLTPRLPKSSFSPRLRHGRAESRVVEAGGTEVPAANTTCISHGRSFSNWVTPLLRTPALRRQQSSVNSPLVVDRFLLDEPARSPATFGDRLKEMEADEKHEIHPVWQVRDGSRLWKLDPDFLMIAVKDCVCIRWFDANEEVFETDHTFLNVVPGGRHSCYSATTPLEADDAEVGELHQIWSGPEADAADGTTSSHANAPLVVNFSMRQPQLPPRPPSFMEDPLGGTGRGVTPLRVQAHTPMSTLSDSGPRHLNSADRSVSGTPMMGRPGVRARRLASEVFLPREDSEHDTIRRVLSFQSDTNAMHTAVSHNTPLISAHSRQPSTNWMVQQSESRQCIGNNCQSFMVAFPRAGNYYFVCSKHKRTMRLHVQVTTPHSLVAWRYVFVGIAAVIVVALVVIVVVVLAYWMQHSTYLFGEKDSASYEQYLAFLDIHDLITMKLFPFLAVGVLIVLLVILSAIGWLVYRCFKPASRGAYNRGVKAAAKRVLDLGMLLMTFGIIVLLFIAYGLELNVTNGVNSLALSIGSSVTSTVNTYSTAVLQVNYIINETTVLFPNASISTEDAYSLVSQVNDLMSSIVDWTSFVEDIAQVLFRAIPVLIYLCMQLGLFAACLTIGSLVLKFRRAAVATTWILAASLGIFAALCGVEFAVTSLFSRVYSSVVVLRDNPADFGTTLGLAADSFLSQLFSYCTIQISDVSIASDYVNEILQNINDSLDEKSQEEFSVVYSFINDIVPTTMEALANYTGYIDANLDILQRILDADSRQVNDLLKVNAVPYLKAIVSVLTTFEGLVNCQVIRDIMAGAIPVFQNQVQHYNLAVFVFLLIIFGVSFILLCFSTGSTYALHNPRRTWCNVRTGRWFRFRYSYKTHINTIMMGTKARQKEHNVLQWLVAKTDPFMSQLRGVKLVCYSACTLMFFDCILIVLFNEVSRGTERSKMLQAISYIGCATLFFLLLATLIRQAVVRWIFHFCSLVCAVAVLGVSAAQTIVGFVYFGQCLNHSRYEASTLTYTSPVYLTCSATYMGYNLEVAIYSIVIFLNSITLVTTLGIQLRYERSLTAAFQHRHYHGMFSPIERLFPKLQWIFADHLFVKRIYIGFLTFIVVVFLVLFAVLDIGKWSVVHEVSKKTLAGLDIVQVIDPMVSCNGDQNYCQLRTNQIIWACAHNAHSSLEDDFVLPNHFYNITHQLQAGVRSFMVDVWYDKINSSISDEEDVYVCHEICLMGRRLWRDFAKTFKEFLDKYPGQVIMIIFEQYVNSSQLGTISDEVGLTQYVWHNTQTTPNFNPDYVWPTLQELVNTNQRALMYNDELATSNLSIGAPEWLYYSYDFQFENGYTTPNVSAWMCDIGRGWCTSDPEPKTCNSSSSNSDSSDSGICEDDSSSASSDSYYDYLESIDITNCTVYGADTLWKNGSAVYNAAFNTNPSIVRSKMSTMNHFITNGASSPVPATAANQPLQVQFTTYLCSSTWNAVVNILAFDFWNIADPLSTIEAMNQNLVKYGANNNFKDAWSKMLFGKKSVNFS